MPYLRNLEVLFLLTLLLATSGSVGFAQAPRVPAEWQPHEATWMQWPKGIESSYRPNFAAIIDVIQDYEPLNIVVQSTQARSQAQNYLANQGVGLTNLSWHILPYDWAWLRDNGPLWVEEGGEQRVQDWSFDGWGGIVPFWDLDDAVPCQIAAIESVPCEVHSLINERGNLEFNGVDTLITSWPVFTDRNPASTQAEVETLLEEATGVTNIVWLLTAPVSDEFTGGHVDGIARFIDENTVVVSRYLDQSDPDAPVYEQAAQIIAAAGFEVLRLDIPGDVTYFGVPMAANYINWLVGNDFVLMSGFGVPSWDNAAVATVESFFPGRSVHIVETLEIWYWGGGVHCVTNDQPRLLEPRFIRGDSSADGSLDIADPIANLVILFDGHPTTCEKSQDSNDDGQRDISDPVHLLAFLFNAGPAPPPPFPSCGSDPTPDSLTCSGSPACP